MAAGSDFTLVPSEVVELEPDYHNVITESESMKKEFLNMSATATQRYRMKFNAMTTANKNTLLTHFKDQSGGYYKFIWKSVPAYIEAGGNITGRWVRGSLSITPIGYKMWQVSVTMEKDT